MTRHVFVPLSVRPGQAVRFDTSENVDSPAQIRVRSDPADVVQSRLYGERFSGLLPEILGPDGVDVLYQKTLNYRLEVVDTVALPAWVDGPPPEPVGSGGGGGVSAGELAAAVALLQDKATAATDDELASAVATINTALAGKQAAATAATDAELASAVALLQDKATAATDSELAGAVAVLQAAISTKQDASNAATDAELAAAVALLQDKATAATDAELAAAVATINTALTTKQDAATAATDAELATAISALNAIYGTQVYTVATRPAATGSGVVVFVSDDGPGTLYKDTAAGVWTPLNPGEINYAENITGVIQSFSASGSNDITGLSIAVPASVRPVWVVAKCRVGLTVAPPAAGASTFSLNILDDLGNTVASDTKTLEGGAGLNGTVTLELDERVGSLAAGRTYKAQINKTGSAATYFVFNGATSSSVSTVVPAFRSFIAAMAR